MATPTPISTAPRTRRYAAPRGGSLHTTPATTMPVSPPETDRESPSSHAGGSGATTTQNVPPFFGDKMIRKLQSMPTSPLPPLNGSVTESPEMRYHRMSSSLPYLRSPMPDNRRPVGRGPKWLVMVIPPASLHRESAFGSLIHHGPPGRFLNGTLVPLQTTLFGQVNSIAREFGLPSTIGVCLYLQVTEGPHAFSPRLSDETWSALWAPFFTTFADDRLPTLPAGLPIAGRIEFDLDLRQARWYHSWITGALNQEIGGLPRDDGLDGSEIEGSRQAGTTHSQTMAPMDDGTGGAERFPDYASESGMRRSSLASKYFSAGSPSVISASTTRPHHAPRRLSLLGRRDHSELPSIHPPRQPSRLSFTSSVHADEEIMLNANSHEGLFGVESNAIALPKKVYPHGLSPIPQSHMGSPMTAGHHQKDVNSLVQQWRHTSAGASPVDPVETPQRSPPAHTSTSADPAEEFARRVATMNMDDYSWSISSLGPPSPLPSPLPLNEAVGVVEPASPVVTESSFKTSWGPSDYTIDWNAEEQDDGFRYPTPDLAARMIEDSPITPLVLDAGFVRESPVEHLEEQEEAVASGSGMWPYVEPANQAPLLVDALSYVDPAEEFQRRVAAMNMDDYTWSISSLGPPSPLPSPSFELHEFSATTRALEHASPVVSESSFRTSWGPSDGTIDWDIKEEDGFRYPTPDLAARMIEDSPITPLVLDTFDLEMPEEPIVEEQEAEVEVEAEGSGSRMGWPYSDVRADDVVLDVPEETGPSRMGWPYHRATEDAEHEGEVESSVTDEQSNFGWPYSNAAREADMAVDAPADDPLLSGMGWPHYEAVVEATDAQEEAVVEAPTFGWPYSVASRMEPVTLSRPAAAYPWFDLYPKGYPEMEIYPGVPEDDALPKSLSVRLPRSAVIYPSFDLYPAGYPTIEIYPALYPAPAGAAKSLPVSLPRPAVIYPWFDLYPAGYPTIEIYPTLYPAAEDVTKSLPVSLPRPAASYPDFELYPMGYPSIVIYPDISSRRFVSQEVTSGKDLVLKGPSICLPASYPMSVVDYPSIIIYPNVTPTTSSQPTSLDSATKSLPVRLNASYPTFNLYPAGYPSVNIYPDIIAAPPPQESINKALPVALAPSYPTFDLYPAGYPSMNIYPAVSPIPVAGSPSPCKSLSVRLAPSYPNFELYPAGYPSMSIYPNVFGLDGEEPSVELAMSAGCQVRLPSVIGYPIFDLYPGVYPVLEIYPPQTNALPVSQSRPVLLRQLGPSLKVIVSSFEEAAYPIFNLYPAVYPFVTPYPSSISTPVRPEPEQVRPRLPSPPSRKSSSVANKIQNRDSIPIPLPPTPPETSHRKHSSGRYSWRPATPPRTNHIDLPRDTPTSPSEGISSPEQARSELHALIFGDVPVDSSNTAPNDFTSPTPSSGLDSATDSSQVNRYSLFSPAVRMPIVLPSPSIPAIVNPELGLPANPRASLKRRATVFNQAIAQQHQPQLHRRKSSITFPKLKKLEGLQEAKEEVPPASRSPGTPSPTSSEMRRASSLGKLRTNDDLFKKRQSMHNSRGSLMPTSPISGGSSSSGSSSPSPIQTVSLNGNRPSRPISRLDPSKYGFR
ncbi:hypothetical protein FRB93_004907 [Tulasnella sp. JGI-2019a]|nr:hypothetical protein FRB93_004907 [Tulasnella sp. JGI-2019a]